jgi:hypothetical protein
MIDRHGRGLDGGYSDAEGLGREPTGQHAICLHPELINVVRQQQKWRVPISLAIISVAATALITIAAVLYSQGQAAGATAVRVQTIEVRAREDREEEAARAERQRQRDAAMEVRQTEWLQAQHAIDSRLARIEERLPPRR